MRFTNYLLLASLALSAPVSAFEPTTEVQEDAVVGRTGFFLAGTAGVFSAIGGYKADPEGSAKPRISRSLSSAEPTLGLLIGYDFLEYVGLGVRLQQAYVSGAARSLNPDSPTDFGLLMADANLSGAFYIVDRLKLEASLFGGFTWMTPAILPASTPYGVNGGLALGIKFETLLSNMVVGLDLSGYANYLLDAPADSSNLIWAFSVAPVVKYVL